MTQAQSLIGGLCRQVGAAQWELDKGVRPEAVAQALALQIAALAVAHAPDPAAVAKQVGADVSLDAAGVVRVPVVGQVVDGGRVRWAVDGPRAEWSVAWGHGVSVVGGG